MANINKVEFGFSKFAYQILGEEASTPVIINGSVKMKLELETVSDVFEADDIDYWTDEYIKSASGELEIALLPDEFLTNVLGYIKLANGALAEPDRGGNKKPCHIIFEGQGDKHARRRAFLNVNFGVADEGEYATGRGVRTTTLTFNVQGQTLPSGERIRKFTLNPDDAGYSTIFESGIQESDLTKAVGV